MRPSRIPIALARVAPAAMAVLLAALTLAERPYLDSVGWSPVRRAAVEWPSLLALGPYGLVLTAALLVAGTLGICVGWRWKRTADTGALRVSAWLFLTMNLGVIAVAFSADAPRTAQASWHGALHDAAYPVLVLAAIAGAALAVATRGGDNRWRAARGVAITALLVMLGGVAAGFFDSIAELGRYLSVGGLLMWSALIAWQVDEAAGRR